jgi:hypothetical protein
MIICFFCISVYLREVSDICFMMMRLVWRRCFAYRLGWFWYIGLCLLRAGVFRCVCLG